MFWLLLLLLNIVMVIRAEEDLVVETTSGLVRGKVFETRFGEVEGYFGIPYAEPPVDELRFKRPKPIKPWEGIRNVTEFGAACIQRFFKGVSKLLPGLGDIVDMRIDEVSEDCLFVNIWVPRPRPTNASVVVVFHGGAFIMGSGSITAIDGAIMAAHQRIVYVTFNSRLGSLGFTYVDDPSIEPNVGMLDQVLVLKWVNENIAQFGGDPESVTLSGESSGSIAIGLHLVSPLSRGLFKRVIMQSGSGLYEMATKAKDVMRWINRQMAEYMDCPGWKTSNQKIAECLRSAEAGELQANEPQYGKSVFLSFWFFPVVDGYFLPKHPEDAYKDGEFPTDADLLMGVVRNEGTVFLMAFDPLTFNPLSQLPASTLDDINEGLETLFYNATKQQRQTILDHYFIDESDKGLIDAGDAIIGDFKFNCGLIRTSKYFSSRDQGVYAYFFDHRPKVKELVRWLGIPHGSDLLYSTGYALSNATLVFDEEDQVFSERLITYVGNFVKTGDPNHPMPVKIHWPPYTSRDHRQIVLAPRNRTILVNMKEQDCQFWDNLGHVYYHDKP